MPLRKPTRLVAVSVVTALAVSGSAAVASSVITSANIKNGTIQVKDLSKKARTSLKGKRGSPGPAGSAGPQGAAGPPGPVVLKYVVGPSVASSSVGQKYAATDCPAGFHVVGGGVVNSAGTPQTMDVNSSAPTDNNSDGVPDDGWFVDVDVLTANSVTIIPYAICSLANAVSREGARIAAKA
jgi:hypothetical protein